MNSTESAWYKQRWRRLLLFTPCHRLALWGFSLFTDVDKNCIQLYNAQVFKCWARAILLHDRYCSAQHRSDHENRQCLIHLFEIRETWTIRSKTIWFRDFYQVLERHFPAILDSYKEIFFFNIESLHCMRSKLQSVTEYSRLTLVRRNSS